MALPHWQKFVYPYQISSPFLVVTTRRVLTDIHLHLKFIPKQTCAIKTWTRWPGGVPQPGHLFDPLHLALLVSRTLLFIKEIKHLNLLLQRDRYTENAQKYVLVFRHLGLITSCPRWVLVFPENMGNLHTEQLIQWKLHSKDLSPNKKNHPGFHNLGHYMCDTLLSIVLAGEVSLSVPGQDRTQIVCQRT